MKRRGCRAKRKRVLAEPSVLLAVRAALYRNRLWPVSIVCYWIRWGGESISALWITDCVSEEPTDDLLQPPVSELCSCWAGTTTILIFIRMSEDLTTIDSPVTHRSRPADHRGPLGPRPSEEV
ncbi:hypothetical protein EYF80_052205 [Liparis tanakae]|uniref:Uncharacterized protein n=1 Tax=Liparis tanakae TaxID=230148 RepID=A0A4Z2F8Z0_9TELE|nr:hypothetical protein EYF80_052205 [Liparis tanakae]